MYSRRLLDLADGIEAGLKFGYGSAESQRKHAAEVRALADEIDIRFGKGSG